MPPTVHLIRHAQGHHNVSNQFHLLDPLLTPLGERQCAELARTFPHAHRISLIVASPLKRTLYTALLSFSSILTSKNLHIIALPEIQETSDLPCDTGSPKADLEREFSGKPVDLRLVEEGWDSKRGRWGPEAEAIEERAWEARRWLAERSEKEDGGEVVVVTHGGFLHYFTEDWRDAGKFHGTGWANTEFRTYTFDPSTLAASDTTPKPTYSLIETQESRARRAGTEKPLTEAEQRNLEEPAQIRWEEGGDQRKVEQTDGDEGINGVKDGEMDGEMVDGDKEEEIVRAKA